VKLKFALVIWGDAHQTLDQKTMDEVRARHRPDPIHTQGYILIDDEKGISIAGELMPATNGESEESYRHLTFIPRGWVIEVQEIRRVSKRKKRGAAPVEEVAAPISVSEKVDAGHG